VEAYKKNMFALLEKPGYEKETEEIKKRLQRLRLRKYLFRADDFELSSRNFFCIATPYLPSPKKRSVFCENESCH